jgi:hypothetical protein
MTQEVVASWVESCHALVRQLRAAQKPLLAAIHGTAVGGGLEVVLHCDVRFAADDARLGQPEVNIAFIPPVGATQALANVEATCHLVVILTEGGRLAFVGTPAEARSYFDISRLGDVYRQLAGQTPEHWQTRFLASPYFARYVHNRFPASVVETRVGKALGTKRSPRQNLFRQAAILTRRYLAVWRGDRLALGAMLGQSLLVALLLAIVFGKLTEIDNPAERVPRTVNLLFLLTISSFWFGCNNAAKELV